MTEYTLQYCYDNLEVIGSGSTRAVFAIDDSRVIKIPFVKGGIIQCRNEIAFYDKYKSIFPLCAVLQGSCENLIVQTRAVTVEECYDSADEAAFRMFDTIFWEAFECDDTIDISQYLDGIRDKTDSRIMEFMDVLSKIDLKLVRTLCYDISCYNIGLIDNRLVIIDYGFPGTLTKGDEYYDETEQQKMLQL